MTVSAGCNHNRACKGNDGSPTSCAPGRTPSARANRAGRVVEAGDGFELGIGERPHIVGGAVERERPVLVDQRRQDACEGEHRIGYGTARHARVHGTVERAHLYVGGGEAA